MRTANLNPNRVGHGYTRYPQIFEAHYSDVSVSAYQGNPLIETLPPMVSRDEIDAQLQYLPPYDDAQRWLPSPERLQLVTMAMDFFQPLPQHLDLVETMSTMISHGYMGRNPAIPTYLPTARRHLPSVVSYRPDSAREPLPTSGFTLIGESGIGKSRGVSRVLWLYPQVILHSAYKGSRFSHLQIVYLKISCPHDGSRKALCKEFFRAVDQCLGTSYYEHYVRSRESVDTMLIAMGNLCLLHHIGVLVIDEIQNLREARQDDAARMLNFFTQLDNEIKVPVVLIGTPRARSILTGWFSRARRAEGQGGVTWERLRKPGTWDLFVETLWHYQYTHQTCALTPELSQALWDESQGVVDIAIKLYKLTQEWAISREEECITPEAIRQTASERLQFVQPFLNALREGNYQRLATDPMFDDLIAPDPEVQEQRGSSPADDQDSTDSSPDRHDMESSLPQGDTADDTELSGSVSRAPVADSPLYADEELAREVLASPVPAEQCDMRMGEAASNPALPVVGLGAKRVSTIQLDMHADRLRGLLEVFDARQESVAPYDAFHEAGLTRSVGEYLPNAPVTLHLIKHTGPRQAKSEQA
jgi:hypothetical protein